VSIGHWDSDIPKIMSTQNSLFNQQPSVLRLHCVLLAQCFNFVKTEISIKFLVKLENYGIDIYKTLLNL
jgi:hypothetical protein